MVCVGVQIYLPIIGRCPVRHLIACLSLLDLAGWSRYSCNTLPTDDSLTFITTPTVFHVVAIGKLGLDCYWTSFPTTLPIYHFQWCFGLGVGTSASGCFGSLLWWSKWLGPAMAFILRARDIRPALPGGIFIPWVFVASSPHNSLTSTVLLLPVGSMSDLPTMMCETFMTTICISTLTFRWHISCALKFHLRLRFQRSIGYDICRLWGCVRFPQVELNSKWSRGTHTRLCGVWCILLHYHSCPWWQPLWLGHRHRNKTHHSPFCFDGISLWLSDPSSISSLVSDRLHFFGFERDCPSFQGPIIDINACTGRWKYSDPFSIVSFASLPIAAQALLVLWDWSPPWCLVPDVL